MRRLLLRSVALGPVLLAACLNLPSLKPIEQVGEDVRMAGVSVERAGVSMESTAVTLRKGLEGLDPAGIKNLLATNAELRAELERVQTLYLQGMGQGVVDITGRLVQVRVTRTTGDLIINAWVDDRSNQFWSGRITARNLRLPVSLPTFMRAYPMRQCAGRTGVQASTCMAAAQRTLPDAAEQHVQNVFRQYLSVAPAAPAPELPPSLANPRFGGSGEHKVYFEVVPVQADAAGNWSARLEIWLVDTAGRESNVFLYDVDSARHPGHRMQTPLAPVVATLVVRTAP